MLIVQYFVFYIKSQITFIKVFDCYVATFYF